MAQLIKLAGWLDPEHPAIQKEAGLQFRLKLSEIPLSPWKKGFSELSRNQKPTVTIEQDVMILNCEVVEIEAAVDRIKQWLRKANETISRDERAVEERVARQMLESETQRAQILAAVKNIRFDDV